MALLLTGAAAQAQNTQITASNIGFFGGAKFTGSFCLTPTDGSGNAITLVTPTGQQFISQTQQCWPVVAGVLSSLAIVPDTSLTQPANACYKLTLVSRTGNTVGQYTCLQPTGATWSFDSYVPNGTAAVPALTLPQFQTNGVPNQSQTALNLICTGCTNTGTTVTIPSGGTASYTAPGTGAIARTLQTKAQDYLSLKDYGAVGDGAHMSVDSAALIAAVNQATVTGQSVYAPAGTYLLDNSAAAALSGAKPVHIYGDGPSTVFSCQTIGTNDCIQSTGATGFAVRDLAIKFGPTATTRSSGYALNVQSCTNCDFRGLTLSNGDLSAMRLASSVHTKIRDLTISNFFANGLFTLNNQDLTVDGVSCTNNQDACFEASWYDSQYSAYSIPCQGITASNINSNNDTEAILVNACLDVTVTGFTAYNSGKESVFVGQDPTTTTAHWPDRVTITGGSIYGAGYGTNANNTTTAQALYINVATNPGAAKSKIVFSNINASHIAGWGLAMADLQNDDVQISNVKYYDVGQGNTGSPVGCLQTEGNEVNLDNVACSTSGSYSLYDTNTLRLTGSNLVMNASNQLGTGINALYLSTTATGYVNIQGVSVKDTNATTWASDIYDGTSSGQHQITGISLQGTVTPIGPTSVNSNTTYTWADTTHSWVLRNGGTIFSFAPPNVYVEPTAGTTTTSQVNGAVFYLQSKCRQTPTSTEQVESTGWGIIYPTLTTESLFINHLGGCGFPMVLDTTTAATVMANAITANTVNQVVYSAGVAGAGIGVAQSAWSSATAYPQCSAVASGGHSYLAVAASTNVTPGTNSAIWWQVPNANTPTAGDCAFYIAASQVNGASGAELVLPPGNTNLCIGLMEPTVSSPGYPNVVIRGAGKDATTLTQTCSITAAPITQPDSGTAYALADVDWEGFTLDANFLAPAVMNVYGAQQFRIKHVQLRDPADGSDHYIEFGHAGGTNHTEAWTYEMDLEDIDTADSHGPGTGATVTATVSGGVPTFTVTAGGSSYSAAYTQLILSGTGSSADVPCTSRGTDTITVSSGVITAITTTATGCTSPLYAAVFGGNRVTYCFKFNDASDSKSILALTPTECNTGVYNANISSQLDFVKTHPIGTMIGISDAGINNFYSTQIDTVYRYGFDFEGANNVENVYGSRFQWNNFAPPGSSDYHFGTLVNSPVNSPFAINIMGDGCGNAASFSGYNHFLSATGPGLPQFAHAYDSTACDSTTHSNAAVASGGLDAYYRDDFITTNAMTSTSIGSPSGQSCGTSTTYLDNTSPGNLSAISGTVSGAGVVCVPAGGGYMLFDAATAPSWSWEGRVYVPVLPATTAGSYQAGLTHTYAASPWTTGIGFYLSSANGVPNDWYCTYGSNTIDSTVAATAAWARLTMYSDGASMHWYINGVQVCGSGKALGYMPTIALETGFTSVAGSTTSVTMALDYWWFKMNPAR